MGRRRNVEVWAYSNVDTVELFLNGESLGERSFENKTTNYGESYLETSDGKLHLEWDVPFEAGTLKAVAKKDGEIVAEKEIKTAGDPAAVKLTPDRRVIDADGEALSFVTVDIIDENGVIVPNADNLVEFEVTGGELVGVDNGNASSVERYKDDKRKAFSGKALAIVQSNEEAGPITIKATSKGLSSDIELVYSVDNPDENKDSIIGVSPISINIDKGNIPELPSTIDAVYGDGSVKAVNVIWDSIDESEFNKVGVIKVSGAVEVTDIKAEAVITVRDIIGVKPFSTAVELGEEPVLPSEAWVIYSDGYQTSKNVVWEEINLEDYNSVGNFTVYGIVEGIDDFKAEARIRVTDELERENIALSSSLARGKTFASQTGSGDSVSHLNDGIISYDNSPKNRWTNWPATSSEWIGVEWEEAHKIDNVSLYTFADSGCEKPTNIEVEYFDGTNWIAVENQAMNPSNIQNNERHDITFSQVITNKIRVKMDPTQGKSLAATELEVYGEVLVENDEALLANILINNEPLEGFNSETTNYLVDLDFGSEIPEIAVEVLENGTEVIIPPTELPGKATIVVTSESEKNTREYTIDFRVEDPGLNRVEIALDNTNLSEDDLVPLNITSFLVDGSEIDNSLINLEYFISDKSVIEMRNGNIAAIGEGTSDIYIEGEYKGEKVKSNTLRVSVEKSLEDKIIISLSPATVVTEKGVKPILPETVVAKYNVGLSRNKEVVWDSIPAGDYSEIGTFNVYGTVEGTSIRAMAKVEVKGVLTVENLSTVTLLGEMPKLPETVDVHYSDKSILEKEVVWDEINPEDYNAIGTFEVLGKVEGINEKAKIVVRVSDQYEEGLNISRFQNGYDYPRTAASYSNEPPHDNYSNDRLAHVNNDIISFDNSPHDRWTNWKRQNDPEGWVSVQFGRSGPEEHYVDEMKVHYFTDNGVSLPHTARVQYKENGQWINVSNQTEENGEFENSRVYKFDKVKTSELRLFMVATPGKALGITELQVFKKDVVENTTNTASEILLDGIVLEGFDSNTFEYTVNLEENKKVPEITAKALDNASVTVIQAQHSNDTAKVIVKGEDGISQNIYEIRFVSNEHSVSKEELNLKLAEANELLNGNYTEESKAILNQAIEYSTIISNDENATEYDVNSAISLLNDAIVQLEEIDVEISADLNNDGKVDVGDLSLAAKHYGQEKTEYDLNGNSIVDQFEINYISDTILNSNK